MTGQVRSLRVLKESVVVGFPDGTEAEVPLDQLTWEGRPHVKPGERPIVSVFYLTTPIYYVNAPAAPRPRVHHDRGRHYVPVPAAARATDVWFLTGTDEHGDKIAQAAAKAGVPPQALRRPRSRRPSARSGAARASPTTTSSAPPSRGTRGGAGDPPALWDKGEIYFGKYGGQYCYGCERFYTEKEIVDGKCPDHQTPLTHIEEENYFFRMSKYQDWLSGTSRTIPDVIQPDRYRNELLGFLREPLQDLSISRPRTRLEWGIPLPFDDQLRHLRLVRRPHQLRLRARRSGRRSAIETLLAPRPAPDRQGHPEAPRDLLALHAEGGRPALYTRLNVARLLDLGGGKMSKCLGNVVARAPRWPTSTAATPSATSSCGRCPSARTRTSREEALVERLNAELANDLGNLVARATTMIGNFGGGAGPRPGVAAPGRRSATRSPTSLAEVEVAMGEFAFHRALAEIWEFIGAVNRYIDAAAVGARQGPRPGRRLRDRALDAGESLRCLGIVLDPFLPDAARRIRAAIGRRRPAAGRRGVGRPAERGAVEKSRGSSRGSSRRRSPGRPRARTAATGAAGARGEAAPGAITLDDFKKIDLRVAESWRRSRCRSRRSC